MLSFTVFWEISSQSLGNKKVNKVFGPLLVIKAKRRKVLPLFTKIFPDRLKGITFPFG